MKASTAILVLQGLLQESRCPADEAALEEAIRALDESSHARIADEMEAWAETKMTGPSASRLHRTMVREWATRLRGSLATQPAQASEKDCTWEVTSNPYEGETWDSACGVKYCFTEAGPVENNHRFCHGCGKPLVVATSSQETASE